jgi:hypothetical protein
VLAGLWPSSDSAPVDSLSKPIAYKRIRIETRDRDKVSWRNTHFLLDIGIPSCYVFEPVLLLARAAAHGSASDACKTLGQESKVRAWTELLEFKLKIRHDIDLSIRIR